MSSGGTTGSPPRLVFDAAVSRPSGTRPTALAATDLDGDGIADLLVANQGDNAVRVLLHSQDYRAAGDPYATGASPSTLALADINGDGNVDLLVGCSNAAGQDLSVLRGNGVGTFLPAVQLSVGVNVTGVTTSDFNGDGRPDVAVGVRSQGKAYLMMNTSQGAEVAFNPSYQSFELGSDPVTLRTADVNGDGRDDLVSTSFRDGQVDVLVGLVPSAFERPVRTAQVGAGPVAVATGKLAGSSSIDVVTANRDEHTVSVLKGRGDGTFAAAVTLPAGAKPTAVAIADVDLDGWPDLVVADSASNAVAVLSGSADGTFAAPVSFAVGSQPMALVVADLDGDGRPDVATANLGGDVSILYNRSQR
jgi:hypothetical protein